MAGQPWAPARLHGRETECAALDAHVAAVRAGQSRALVVRGEPGIGKTALLEYVASRSEDCRVIRADGVESEMELPFAAVHQLSQPLLSDLDRLPSPQREALETAFGLSSGQPPDRFFVGLALLSHFSGLAEGQPLVCIIDDAQWLDRSSAQVLSFVARRLQADAVAIVLAERDGDSASEFDGLPELRLRGLSEDDAIALVTSTTLGPLDKMVRGRLIAEARGNPLALLELPRGRLATASAGGFAVPREVPLPGRIQEGYRRRVARLPDDTQELLLLAAADPVGDPSLFWRAAAVLGLSVGAAAPAESDGLLEIEARVGFRHPLLRSAVYRGAAPGSRRRVHQALATVTDPMTDPDRRAWHRAQSVLGPDDSVAVELERSAGRAQARGGLAAAAAFLQRSVALTHEPARRADRALAAAQASLQAGAFDVALGLVAAAESGPLDELGRARASRLHAEVAFAQNRGGEAPRMLLEAARGLEQFDVRQARDTYLDAWAAGLFAGSLAREGGSLLDISRAVASAPRPEGPVLPSDLLLDGLATVFTAGRPAAVAALQAAVEAFTGSDVSEAELLKWGWLASRAANLVWDHTSALQVAVRAAELAREEGALEILAVVDNACGQAAAAGGDLAGAARLMAEVNTLKEATGTRIAPHAGLVLAGLQGDEDVASKLIEGVIASASTAGQGTAVQYACWARAVLMNGLGRYDEALAAAVLASEHTPELHVASWALVELVEAAARADQSQLAVGALRRLADHVDGCESDWALGVHARCRALLETGDAAESSYGSAIHHLGRTSVRPDLARAHLLYGEWLRREGRRVDARAQLRAAHDLFVAIGMEAFSERARHELLATGEKVRSRTVETRDRLTPQEALVAQLAVDGLTNPEIGARLYLSPRTVEWHLGKVFTKLGVTSRKELSVVLPTLGVAVMPAS